MRTHSIKKQGGHHHYHEKMLGIIKHNVSLKPLSYLHVGGIARHFFIAKNINSLLQILYRQVGSKKHNATKNILVIGGATNILFSGRNFGGLIIKNDIRFIGRIGKSNLFVGAGTSMSNLLKYCLKNKLQGLEWASCLPGSVGGAIRGNAGAFGGEIKDSIKSVISVDVHSNGNISIAERLNKECRFSYRDSWFKKQNTDKVLPIIVGAVFTLKPVPLIHNAVRKAKEIKEFRWAKHPMDYPSLGSTFKNIPLKNVPRSVLKMFAGKIKSDPIPVLPVAVILDSAGLKGFRSGKAKFSEKHPNFIVNLGNASASDVKKLISSAKNKVSKKFGIRLEEEIVVVK